MLTGQGALSEPKSEALLERQDKPGEPSLLDRHLATMQKLTPTPLVAGNSARLLVDGPASYRAIFTAISAAREHVNIETYILDGDEVGEKLLALLVAKESQGVQVNLLYDGVGSLGTPDEFIERLRAGGITVCAFNPLMPSCGRVGDPNQRDHRKQVVVDGRVAISGGINFSSVYSSGSGVGRSARTADANEGLARHQRRGPRPRSHAVPGDASSTSWEKQSCPAIAEREYFPKLASQGNKVVRVSARARDDEPGLVYLTLLSAIRESRRACTSPWRTSHPTPRSGMHSRTRRAAASTWC